MDIDGHKHSGLEPCQHGLDELYRRAYQPREFVFLFIRWAKGYCGKCHQAMSIMEMFSHACKTALPSLQFPWDILHFQNLVLVVKFCS